MLHNTTVEQDRDIREAQNSFHISNLIAIIEDMDAKISRWRDASSCNDPDELEAKLATLST